MDANQKTTKMSMSQPLNADNKNPSHNNTANNNTITNLVPKPAVKPILKTTFYRRKLPTPPAISFSSKEGKKLFRQSLAGGTMEGFFVLSEQFRTQDEPSFCGISTLTMVLNSLAVDPQRVWKGVWRWYNETMLDSCDCSLDDVRRNGINFDQFTCLGRSNSLNMIAKRPVEKHMYTTNGIINPIVQKQIDVDNNNVNKSNKSNKRRYYTLNEFRSDVIISCSLPNDPIVIVSYSREALLQTGDGHFSPIGGYNKQNDMVLIMDVARFKYPPHWVKIDMLYKAMCRVDKTCNKTRGWICASNI